jgi:bacterial/archaeal transporter family protein
MPRWLIFSLLTMLLWGVWGVVSKPLSTALSPWQVQTLSTLGLLPVLALLARSKNLRVGPDPRPGFWLAFASGVVGSLGNVAYYATFAAGAKAAAVTPLTALYPIVTIGLALVFLHERLNSIQAMGVLSSLAALYAFNVGGDAGWLTPWLPLALIPIFLWGVCALLQKVATTRASIELVTAAFLLGEFPVALATPLFQPPNFHLPYATWGLLFLLGLFFGLGNLTLIFAYGTGGKASIVTPMASLYSLVTVPFAIWLLNERIGVREAVGVVLALVAVVALGWEQAPDALNPEK